MSPCHFPQTADADPETLSEQGLHFRPWFSIFSLCPSVKVPSSPRQTLKSQALNDRNYPCILNQVREMPGLKNVCSVPKLESPWPVPSYPIPRFHVLLAGETYLWEVTFTTVTLVTPPTLASSEEQGRKLQADWPLSVQETGDPGWAGQSVPDTPGF